MDNIKENLDLRFNFVDILTPGSPAARRPEDDLGKGNQQMRCDPKMGLIHATLRTSRNSNESTPEEVG